MACVGLDVDFLPAAEVFRASGSAQAVLVVCGACHSSSRLSDLVPERSTSYKYVHIRLPAIAARCMQPAGPVHECDRLLGQTRNTVLEQHEQLIAKSKMTVLCRWTICTLSSSVSACA